MPSVPEKDGDRHLAEAAGILKKVTVESPRLAEAHALLGSIYDMQIGRASFKKIALGPEAQTELERAAELEPDNPRIVLQDAVSVLHKPPTYGGSPAKTKT